MDSIVPTNTPPEVQKYFAEKQALLQGEEVQTEPFKLPEVAPEPEAPVVTNTVTTTQVAHEKSNRGYKLVLTHDLYKVTFDVQDISVADFQLAIKVLKSDFRFEPQPNSRFTLECMGKTYNVVYLGGLFDFPSDASWSLTFMLESEENDDTWTPNA